MDIRSHPYWVRSDVHGLSHGLKIARQLSIFTPVCALKYCMVATGNHLDSDSLRGAPLVPPFQVLLPAKDSDSISYRSLLAGALGLEPRAYGFGVRRSTN